LLNRAEKIDLVLDEAPDLVEGSTVRDAIWCFLEIVNDA
jgi:hypothetical protein